MTGILPAKGRESAKLLQSEGLNTHFHKLDVTSDDDVKAAKLFVQQMFGQNQSDVYLPTTISAGTSAMAASCVKDSKTGDVILKLVNATEASVPMHVLLPGLGQVNPTATKTVLTGKPMDLDSFENPRNVFPQSSEIAVGESFVYDAPSSSLTVIRIKSR